MSLRKRKQLQHSASEGRASAVAPKRLSSSRIAIPVSLFLCFFLCVLAALYLLRPFTPRHLQPLDAPRLKDSRIFDEAYSQERLWGTYRSGLYLGLRMRRPSSLLAGLMWMNPTDLSGLEGIRHEAQARNIRFGWTMHNGKDFGIQSIHDKELGAKIETSWVKKGTDWSVRISLKEARPGGLSFFFYLADEAGPEKTNVWSLEHAKIGTTGQLLMKGSHEATGDWSLGIAASDASKLGLSKLGVPVEDYHNLTDVVKGALRQSIQMQFYLRENDRTAVEMRFMDPPMWSTASDKKPNFAAIQIICEAPFEFDIVFVAGPSTEYRFDALSGRGLTELLRDRTEKFKAGFEEKIVKGQNIDVDRKTVMMHALSNLLGGVGYFYGASLVRMPDDRSIVQESFQASLLTAVPSRTSFPRGFLWDEGFHLLVIQKWDPKLCADILAHWLDLLNKDGWMAREQILGQESRSRVPGEFIVQDPTVGNPPTLFLSLMKMALDKDPDALAFLDQAWPRLVQWFEWLKRNHEGTKPGTFRWTSRKTSTDRLNPLTLDSGLDDYPRASHPTEDEYHLDVRCWMALAADAILTIGTALKKTHSEIETYKRLRTDLMNVERLQLLHYDREREWFADYGLHDNARHTTSSQTSNGSNETDVVLGLIPHFGYVSLFPFMLKLLPSEGPLLDRQLKLIEDPDLLWTEYGLRSLSKSSSFYARYNTEHDPPYWRGSIWMNINYLVLEALDHYARHSIQHGGKALRLHDALKRNLMNNVLKEYGRTGFLWEQYDDVTGHGKGVRPFTGWTSLIVLM